MNTNRGINRRNFLKTTGAALGGTALGVPVLSACQGARQTGSRDGDKKMRVALVGTGSRGSGMFGRNLLRDYGDCVEMVGICDKNPGRVAYAHSHIQPDGPAFTDLEEMLKQTRPDWLIVATWDWEHHNNIVTGLEHGCNIICEKPITIDEAKAQIIIDAEQKYDREIIVTFNVRWPPGMARLKELLMQGTIGKITTADFHWNITRSHLHQYLRRWHGESDKGGTLWVHKSTHHFDLVNWWLNSEPMEVFAYADLEHHGPKGPFRGNNCRDCAHTSRCPAYWDITSNSHLMNLYVQNEHYDGYIRDNCVYRKQIDIFEKHSALVKYANNVFLNYSLTADTDHSGIWVAFNGTEGRIEGRVGGWPGRDGIQEWVITPLGKEPRIVRVDPQQGGHSGGDPLMKDKLFRHRSMADPLHQSAGTRDGIMSVLIGAAARRSIESGRPVSIADLTSLEPMAVRHA